MHVKHHLKDRGNASANQPVSSTDPDGKVTECHVDGLGHAFLFRNCRAGFGKWLTADPLGYPDGWNQLAYGVNSPIEGVDYLGASWGNYEMVAYYFRYASEFVALSNISTALAAAWWAVRLATANDYIDTDVMGLTNGIFDAMNRDAENSIDTYVRAHILGTSGNGSRSNYAFGVDCIDVVYALGGGTGRLLDSITWSWHTEGKKSIYGHLYEIKYYEWRYSGRMKYSDSFSDPVDVLNWLHEPNIEVPGGVPYGYGHTWSKVPLSVNGYILQLI